MSSSEDDSDVPEQVSLSASKQQVIGRTKGIAKELAQVKLKQKARNRERDRQLKEQSLKQRAELIPDEEGSRGEDEESDDPRLLSDHLFAAAFNQPPQAPVQSVSKDAPPKAQQKKRKRADPTAKDKILGRAFSYYSEGIWLTPVSSSRAVRTLSKTSKRAAAKRTLPSSSAAKFSSRALNTRGVVSLGRTRGWQRKAGGRVSFFPHSTPTDWKIFTVNTGVMKTTNGPAAHFVRI